MRKCDTRKEHRQISAKTMVKGAKHDVIIQNGNERKKSRNVTGLQEEGGKDRFPERKKRDEGKYPY